MVALLLPVFALRLESSDAGNDPSGTSTREAFDLLAQGFGPGFNGPLLLVAELPSRRPGAARRRSALRSPRRPASWPSRRRGCRRRGTSRCSRPTRARPPRLPPPPTWSTISATTWHRRSSTRRAPPCSSAGSPPARSTSRTCSRQAAAVHRARRGALRAAAVRDLPLARDPDPGGADEPAQHRRRARRHRARVPERLVRRA